MPIPPDTPDTLRETREAQGIDLSALAREVGVHAAHLSKIERGRACPRPALQAAIAEALGVPSGTFAYPQPRRSVELDAIRRDVDAAVATIVACYPALTADQRARLAAHLTPELAAS